jgi:hypothetical protein
MKKLIGQFMTEQQEDMLEESLVEEITDTPVLFDKNLVTKEEMQKAIEDKAKQILQDFRDITAPIKRTMGGGKNHTYFDYIEAELRKKHFKTGY